MTFALKTFEQLTPITQQLPKYNQFGEPEDLYFQVQWGAQRPRLNAERPTLNHSTSCRIR